MMGMVRNEVAATGNKVYVECDVYTEETSVDVKSRSALHKAPKGTFSIWPQSECTVMVDIELFS